MGMDCSACAPHVKELILEQAGVKDVQVNFLSAQAIIEADDSVFRLEMLEKRLVRAGYQIPVESINLRVQDTDAMFDLEQACIQEVYGVRNFVKNEDGFVSIRVYPVQVKGGILLAWFRDHGVNAEIEKWDSGEEEIWQNEQITMLKNLITAVLLATPILWNPSPYLQFILATLLQIFPGRIFYKGLIRAIRTKQWNMDSLMAFSTTLIYLYSTYITFTQREEIKLYFLCEGVLISLVLFGRYLEIVAKGETSQALRRLLGFLPTKARVLTEDTAIEKAIDEIKVGELVIVDSGERIPVDGIIEFGSCMVDESVMTGESIPVEKTKGDTCIGGTLNRQGKVLIRVDSVSEDSVLQRMIEIVRQAQISSAPIQKFADRIAGIFIPVVIMIAVAVCLLWYFIWDKGNLEQAIMTACGVLVVACPCALSLAIPTSIMVGTGRACELGILFKNAAGIQALCRVNEMAFDKTGTLTIGGDDIDRNVLRDDVKEMVIGLKRRGIDVCMISGDQEKIAQQIAGQAGIEHVLAQVAPEGKADAVRHLQQQGKHVAMVGDGVNDAPAMAVSGVGISIENGTEIARDTADIIILKDDMSRIGLAVDVAKGIMRNIYGNLAWALCYNIICIPLAACGVMNPSIASAAMSFSSIAVLLHALRLKKFAGKDIGDRNEN